MSVDLTHINARLEWAKQQIADLESRYPAFRERKPHEIIRKPNPESADDFVGLDRKSTRLNSSH